MTQTATTTESTRPTRALYIAFDMGRDAWQVASSDGGKTRREVKLERTDVERGKADVLAEIAKARTVFGLPGE